MNGLIEIGIDQDVSWSTNEWIHWIGRDGLDSWVVVPINITEVNCNFSDTLMVGILHDVLISTFLIYQWASSICLSIAFCELSMRLILVLAACAQIGEA
ncbi:hypothetical protein TNCV_3569851 [Trichonephila clavipes]|nr:hypothetical protein TNCV_3569851 [Trichonephila clavipes]